MKTTTIIFLWVHPRSLSTAFERSIIQRGDMDVIHEPFGYLYYVHEGRPVTCMTVDPNHPTQYEDIKEMILEKARTTTKKYLFVKDMAFHCFNDIMKDDDFLKRIQSTFIVRDPMKAISSHYSIHPSVTQEEIGHEHQWNLCKRIIDVTGKNPIVVVAEDLEEDPTGVLEAYSYELAIPHHAHAAQWDQAYFGLWDTWKEWHVDVANSTGFHKTDRTKHEKTVSSHPHLQKFYQHHLPFYNQLCQYRVNRKTVVEKLNR
eukprot:TRINITY_DN146_c0_g1_i1.p1 TRINITY_DN146_c0_g1~~TRINITY_DN146_c0_g1_i1.p1  ORF type:complete len:259 (-),score=49.02 TRINITY_DN146_c0_g1_i1:76-852(-)